MKRLIPAKKQQIYTRAGQKDLNQNNKDILKLQTTHRDSICLTEQSQNPFEPVFNREREKICQQDQC